MKKVLFIDRDGTIIVEPPGDFQVDSLEKLEFLPYAISGLKKVYDAGYELVMVSNQDGRGTESFPEEDFQKPHQKMLKILSGEGVEFAEIFIDPSFEHENSPNRKPNTGLLTPYLASNALDLEHSYVVGDRSTDIQLARNLGCKSICIGDQANPEADFTFPSWRAIGAHLCGKRDRTVMLRRDTSETRIALSLNLDGSGKSSVHTGLRFYDHMLDQLAKHSGIDIEVKVDGDLEVDEHHTIEDTAITLGEALRKALGDKKGIERYGFLLPMDEALVQCAIDFSGRPWLVYKGAFTREYVGDFPTEMFEHWLKSFSDHAGINLHLQILEGQNDHHKIEASFKALARCLRQAVKITGEALPSTKGTL